MGSLLLVLLLAGGAYTWVRMQRQGRLAWLQRLNLPGTWDAEHDGSATLELAGDIDRGTYVDSRSGQRETGRWRLTGQSLVFETTSGENVCELRAFGDDRIGLDGPGRKRLVYRRRQNNVVPLRSGSG